MTPRQHRIEIYCTMPLLNSFCTMNKLAGELGLKFWIRRTNPGEITLYFHKKGVISTDQRKYIDANVHAILNGQSI